jgi:hypothetical protein
MNHVLHTLQCKSGIKILKLTEPATTYTDDVTVYLN